MVIARAATLAIVPLLSIVGHEMWTMTANLRFKTSPADPARVMQAVRYSEHGAARDVLQIVRDAPQPLLPAGPGMVVVKVVGAALNPVDFKMRRNFQPDALIPKPKIPGYDVSGVVVDVGVGVDNFKAGDSVFGMMPIVGNPWGGLAEYTVADASCWAKAPSSIPLVDAAALPLVGLTVMQVVEAAGLKAASSEEDGSTPRHALVQAASGGVGTFAVQYLKNVLKFDKVVGTTSAANAELVTSLGATRAIDYRKERFETVMEAVGGVDVVIDPMAWSYMDRTIGSGSSSASRKRLRPSATYCHILSTDWAPNTDEASPVTAFMGSILKWRSRVKRLLDRDAPVVASSPVHPDGAGLSQLAEYVDAGHIKPVIDKYFDGLDSAIEAFEHLETGHAKGKVVVRVWDFRD